MGEIFDDEYRSTAGSVTFDSPGHRVALHGAGFFQGTCGASRTDSTRRTNRGGEACVSNDSAIFANFGSDRARGG